ncbi:MAG: lipopolysaccharide heptosyltransferase II [Desulfamplus sp.]|nr:lipopolysaccharide heptosyltransferase II [Desulfamplus sp.]
MQNKITHNKSKLKILIRAANWVGDAIMTTPIIRAVKKNYPHAHITLLAKPWVIPVFDNNPYIDDIMVYENSTRHTKGFGTLRLARDIRKKKFDMAILMQNAFEAALITFLGGVPIRIGYNTDGRTLLLNPAIKLDKRLKKGHLIDYYRGILKGVGLVDDRRKLDLFISDSERKEALYIIDSYGLIDSSNGLIDSDYKKNCLKLKPIIGINPGATGGTAKRWFPQRYAELAKRLAQRFNTKILIFGGQADKELGEQIKELAQSFNGSSQTSNSSSNNLNDKQKSQFDGSVCVNLAGKTTLRQAFTLIEKCDLFITNDSGLMHAAAALETRQIAIIGSTDHIATAPSSPNSIMIRVPVPCSPCLKVDCPKKESYLDYHTCMDKISVDMVMEKCESVLESIS